MTGSQATEGIGLVLARIAAALEDDPALLTADGQVAQVEALQVAINACTAAQDAAIVAFMGAEPAVTPYWTLTGEQDLLDVRRSELAAAMHWSESTVASRIDMARTMAADLPASSAAARTGALSPIATRVIIEGARTLVGPIDAMLETMHGACDATTSDDPRALDAPAQVSALRGLRRTMLSAFEERVTAYATTHTPAFLRRHVRNTIVRIDPAGFSARRARAATHHSGVALRHELDGMSTLSATLPTEHALVCWHAIEAIARDEQADRTQPLGLRRARALTALITTGALWQSDESTFINHTLGVGDAAGKTHANALQPRRMPITLNVEVAVDLKTLLGLADAPASIGGDGIVPAKALHDLLADAAYVTLRRVITDPTTGHRLDTGVRRYLLTERERARILARDQRCRFPGCGQPASRCECDHALPYADGGATSAGNLGALCTRHHQAKTHTAWEISTSNDDGSCTWRSPLGRRYHHDPVPVLPWNEGRTDTDITAIHEAISVLHVHASQAWGLGLELDTSIQRERLDSAAHSLHAAVAAEECARIALRARRDGMLVTLFGHALAGEIRASGRRGCDATTGEPVIHAAVDTPPF